MRRAVVAHLVDRGGSAASAATCTALGIAHRQSLAGHVNLLIRGGFAWVRFTGRGNQRAAIINVTRRGRTALARMLNSEPMEHLSP